MNKLRKRPTFDELINYLNNQPTIKYPGRKGINLINDMMISNLLFDNDNFDNRIINDTILTGGQNNILMLDKYVQKDYPLQNYDLFPDMYHIIDATSEYKPNTMIDKSDNINQTIRFMLKNIDTPYSSFNSSSKPPSSLPDPNIYRPTPDPSPINSKEPSPEPSREPSREPTPIPSEPSIDPPTPIRIKKGFQSSSSSSKSLSSSSSQQLPPEEDIDVYDLMGIKRTTATPPISIASSKPVSISSLPISIQSSAQLVNSSPAISVASSPQKISSSKSSSSKSSSSKSKSSSRS